MKFELSKLEIAAKEKYLKKIKKKYGTYGLITYSFTPTGIGNSVSIRSNHNNKEKDITDYNW